MFEFSSQINELKKEETRLSDLIGTFRNDLKTARSDLKKFRKARTQLEKISGIISEEGDTVANLLDESLDDEE